MYPQKLFYKKIFVSMSREHEEKIIPNKRIYMNVYLWAFV